eukprot:GFKZ01005605.1.p1 GENE.GFKZ01005605.1~~GFKZ01005605.1.p1  ORF type:complete len:581 (+),score=51.51 GFKZ01005605.1:212-1954(+)
MALLTSNPSSNISVISWNCLADCYFHASLSKRLQDPNISQWDTRFRQISQILRKSQADIICLQEVDHYNDHYKPFLQSLNYMPFYLQRIGRKDGVLVAINPSKFEVLLKDSIQFDDLANLSTSYAPCGLRSRFRRRNVALVLQLRLRQHPSLCTEDAPPRHLTVCSAHLFWNPNMPDVKTAQTRYLLQRITFIRRANGLPPSASILAGDFNSIPHSITYNLISNGIPFRANSGKCYYDAAKRSHRNLIALKGDNGVFRFLCDDGLVRLARMLRLLGLDAVLYDAVSGKKWTREKACVIFARARSEKRILVTTNTWLVKRAECPEAFLITSPPDKRNLEVGLAEMLAHYNLNLKRADILSACAKCGGRIEMCTLDDPRLDERKFPTDRQLFICSRCHQVYWESASCNGPSKKARKAAERLFAIVQKCQQSKTGVVQNGECSNEIAEISKRDCYCSVSSTSPGQTQNCISSRPSPDRGEDDHQKSHFLKYRSAFAVCNGEEPIVTNVNGEFRGTLDYIFVAGAVKVLSSNLVNCVSDSDSNCSNSYPNHDWPSDHFMLRANLQLSREVVGRPSFCRTMSAIF